MYFIQGENMATKKAKKADLVAENQVTEVFRSIDSLIEKCLSPAFVYEKDKRTALNLIQKEFEAVTSAINISCYTPDDGDWCGTPPHIGPRPTIHIPWYKAIDSLAASTKVKSIVKQYPMYAIKEGPNVQTLLENGGWKATTAPIMKKTKVHPLTQLQAKIPEKICTSISKAIINYLDTIEKGQLAIIQEIERIIPNGIELNFDENRKPVYPNVDVIIPYPKTPIPDPKIPLDPKIPIPYPKTPLDPKIPIPRPEIKIHGPYVIKDLEIKLAEVERIRKSLPKNATKAEKKAAANAEQQIKNLLKAAKRAEPKAVKKASVQKAPKKKK